ncbi:hypothetical protein ACO1D2_04445 [Bacillus thuringiensis]|uniref:hypothetical protein n=1 Tax=Bacillus TaxID=1386 RepID=UPI0013F5AABC|nr:MULTISPECIES: hypothetical protein [Bacillus cereus group]MDM8365563.1 hypothetical protein [Bacillus thuringiensis]HDR3896551.1 hypothetical protein [Bacillus cereus]
MGMGDYTYARMLYTAEQSKKGQVFIIDPKSNWGEKRGSGCHEAKSKKLVSK